MKDIHIHHLRLLYALSQLACMLLLPIWLLTDVWDIVANLHKVCNITTWTGSGSSDLILVLRIQDTLESYLLSLVGRLSIILKSIRTQVPN